MRVLAVVAILALGACASEEVPQQPILRIDLTTPDEPECIVDSEFAFGGVRLGASEQDVLGILGAPIRRQTGQALLLDYVDVVLTYPGLEIYLFQDRVVDMTVSTADWTTPSGMRLGMTQDELFEIFGMPAQPSPWLTERSEDTVYDIYFCNGGEVVELGTSFRIHVGSDGIVNALSFGSDTP